MNRREVLKGVALVASVAAVPAVLQRAVAAAEAKSEMPTIIGVDLAVGESATVVWRVQRG